MQAEGGSALQADDQRGPLDVEPVVRGRQHLRHQLARDRRGRHGGAPPADLVGRGVDGHLFGHAQPAAEHPAHGRRRPFGRLLRLGPFAPVDPYQVVHPVPERADLVDPAEVHEL
ncbi:hypothetical protein DQ384_25465 [Sphaerisporangium album]|uniref:Uncharacterized protein n=1 Tax=Sphaerisporangium album TaxID=509200 RepID=A0A367FC05_9ACTN|nr:hypothetical protein DQ384_25465 [Sphaerisporangium album]